MNAGLLGFPQGLLPLTRPEWLIPPQIVGTDLVASVDHMANAAAYDLYFNSSPTDVGATRVGRFPTARIVVPNMGAGERVVTNRGFETGDLTGWMPYFSPTYFVVGTASKKNGNYGVAATIAAGAVDRLYTDRFAASAGQSCAASVWAFVVSAPGTPVYPTGYQLWIEWLTASGTSISAVAVFDYIRTPVGAWSQSAGSLTAPANTAYARAGINIVNGSASGNLIIYFDDISVIGPSSSTSGLYAVRAVDTNGNVSPLFSSWLSVTQAQSTLGDVSANHIQLDPSTSTIKSSNFSAGAAGASISPNGLDGIILNDTGWRSALDTWTYASATTFTVPGNVVARFPKGMKVRLTQTTVKYFYVVNATYSAPNTTVTVNAGSDYALVNAAITENYYSYVATPQGFPEWFNYACAWTCDTAPQPSIGNGTFTRLFKMEGTLIHFWIALVCGSTTTYGGGGTYYFTVPIAQSAMPDSLAHGMLSGYAHRPGVWLVQMMHYWFNPTSFNILYWLSSGVLVLFGVTTPGMANGTNVRMTGQYRLW